MPAYTVVVNGQPRHVDVDADTPLLWVLRDTLGLTGTKFGCGVGVCGACTVLLDGRAQRTCILPMQGVAPNAKVMTIEGAAADGHGHAVQRAWTQIDVPQCGYCQSGQIMAAIALLRDTPKPTAEEVRTRMTNLCRCGTYQRIYAAVLRAADLTEKVV